MNPMTSDTLGVEELAHRLKSDQGLKVCVAATTTILTERWYRAAQSKGDTWALHEEAFEKLCWHFAAALLPKGVDRGGKEEEGVSQSQPVLVSNDQTEAEPSGAGGQGYNREAMQHAVNVFAEIVSSLDLKPHQAEIGKAVIRAGIRKLNLSLGASS